LPREDRAVALRNVASASGLCQAASAYTVALLTVSGLSKPFHGFAAVSDGSFAVGEGEILGLIGPNGSGKSTLFNCIAGMYKSTVGSITFAGAEIAGLSADRRRGPRHRCHGACDSGRSGAGRVKAPLRGLNA
jgi:ABC-type glutathione transport system ATPase component